MRDGIESEYGLVGNDPVWASSALTDPNPQSASDAALVGAVLSGKQTLGDATVAAQRTSQDPYVRRTFLLFGDPLLGPFPFTALPREYGAAIEKFERDRRLPVDGQISDRLVRELAGMTGRPLE